jgi:hypothetical protein
MIYEEIFPELFPEIGLFFRADLEAPVPIRIHA